MCKAEREREREREARFRWRRRQGAGYFKQKGWYNGQLALNDLEGTGSGLPILLLHGVRPHASKGICSEVHNQA